MKHQKQSSQGYTGKSAFGLNDVTPFENAEEA